jgi:hypothetical protein|tara:strand:- start:10 stop:363 length:354 start_codon:yes stop_codon:yes gene_type:complete
VKHYKDEDMESHELNIPRDEGHVTVRVSKFLGNDTKLVTLTDHGTSSCVSRIQIHTSTGRINVWWAEKKYAYEVANPLDVLAEFILTQSMGKVANYVKAHNIMPEAQQDALREKASV